MEQSFEPPPLPSSTTAAATTTISWIYKCQCNRRGVSPRGDDTSSAGAHQTSNSPPNVPCWTRPLDNLLLPQRWPLPAELARAVRLAQVRRGEELHVLCFLPPLEQRHPGYPYLVRRRQLQLPPRDRQPPRQVQSPPTVQGTRAKGTGTYPDGNGSGPGRWSDLNLLNGSRYDE